MYVSTRPVEFLVELQRNRTGKLAILIPTYRTNERARQLLAGICAMAGPDIHVFIGDNSCDAAKHQFLGVLSNLNPYVNLFINRENVGVWPNFKTLLHASRDYEFTMMVGDDDVISPEYVLSSLAALQSDAGASAACGHIVREHADGALASVTGYPGAEEAAMDRVLNMGLRFELHVLPLCMFRRAAARRYFDYTLEHPLTPVFSDFYWAYALLAAGRLSFTGQGMYVYPGGDGGELARREIFHYTSHGLPEEFYPLHRLFWTVETGLFFMGKYSPFATQAEREHAARHFHASMIPTFAQPGPDDLPRIEARLAGSPGAYDSLLWLLANQDGTDPRIFDRFINVLEGYSSDVAQRYAEFVRSTLALTPT